MLLKITKIFILALITTAFACKSGEKTSGMQASKDYLRNAINEKLGDERGVELIYNEDSSLLLCRKISEVTPRDPIQNVKFFVYDAKEDTIIFEDSQRHARVEWFDKERLKIVKIPEIIRHDGDLSEYTYLLNPETKNLKKLNLVDAAKEN